MEETHFLFNDCDHICLKEAEHICFKCGSLMIRMRDENFLIALKPKNLCYKNEISVSLLLENIKNKMNREEWYSVEKFNLLKENSYFEQFKFKRIRITKKLRSFITRFNYKIHSLHSAVYYFDLILFKSICGFFKNLSEACILSCNRKYSLELVSLGCLILAMKYHELEDNIINLSIYTKIFPHEGFTISDLKRVEIVCLQILEYNLDHISSFSLLEIILSQGALFNDDFKHFNFSSHITSSVITNKTYFEEIKEYMKIYTLSTDILNLTVESK